MFYSRQSKIHTVHSNCMYIQYNAHNRITFIIISLISYSYFPSIKYETVLIVMVAKIALQKTYAQASVSDQFLTACKRAKQFLAIEQYLNSFSFHSIPNCSDSIICSVPIGSRKLVQRPYTHTTYLLTVCLDSLRKSTNHKN